MSVLVSVPRQLDTTYVGGFNTVRADRQELAEWMSSYSLAVRTNPSKLLPALIFSSNGQGVALHGRNAEYDSAMASADVIHADGMSVVFASRLLTRAPIKGRSATTDLFHDVAKVAERDELKFFVLGSTESQNIAAVAAMKKLYPKLNIVGRRNGYFGEHEEQAICDEIVAVGTDILWVALGKPKQEVWSARNRHRLAGIGCIKTCGGLFAFLSGETPRAPNWMQNLGLEWAYRLLNEPRRLFGRYFITNVISMYRLFMWSR